MATTPLLAEDHRYCPRVDAAGRSVGLPMTLQRGPICDYLLTLVRNSDGWLERDGVRASWRGSTVWLVPPGQAFRLHLQQQSQVLWLHCSFLQSAAWRAFPHRASFGLHAPGRAAHQQPSPQQLWGLDWPLLAPATWQRWARRNLPDVIDAWRNGDVAGRLHADGLLAEGSHRLWRSLHQAQTPSSAPGSLHQRLHQAETMARRQAGRDLSVADMARAAGYDRSHFTSTYTTVRGKSPGAFLRELRLSEAATLLRSQPLSVAAVAEVCGYGDSASFGRAFKAQHGCSPAAYRARHQGL